MSDSPTVPHTRTGAPYGELHVVTAGTGEPALLFVHGFGCSHEDWTAQIAALSSNFRCTAVDLPGHGDSAGRYEATMTALADAVNAAKAQIGARQVILIGHSLGCKVIREAYCASSADVVGLVFIEGAYYEGDRRALIARASEAVDSVGFAAFAQRHFAAMFVDDTDLALQNHVLARVQRLDPSFARNLYLEAVGWDPLRGRSTLQQIRVPVLVLQCTYNDAQFHRRPLTHNTKTPFMRLVEEVVGAKAEIKLIPNCGHFAPIEAADIVNRELCRFVSRVTHAGGTHTEP